MSTMFPIGTLVWWPCSDLFRGSYVCKWICNSRLLGFAPIFLSTLKQAFCGRWKCLLCNCTLVLWLNTLEKVGGKCWMLLKDMEDQHFLIGLQFKLAPCEHTPHKSWGIWGKVMRAGITNSGLEALSCSSLKALSYSSLKHPQQVN